MNIDGSTKEGGVACASSQVLSNSKDAKKILDVQGVPLSYFRRGVGACDLFNQEQVFSRSSKPASLQTCLKVIILQMF